jgi:hypothetical protein
MKYVGGPVSNAYSAKGPERLGNTCSQGYECCRGRAAQAKRRAMNEAIEFTDEPWKDPQNILEHLASVDSQHVYGPEELLAYLLAYLNQLK